MLDRGPVDRVRGIADRIERAGSRVYIDASGIVRVEGGQLTVIGAGRNTATQGVNLIFGDYPSGNFRQLYWNPVSQQFEFDGFLSASIYPVKPEFGAQTAVRLTAGTGAPNNVDGADGDIFFRSDGGAGTTIYHKRAGAWVGVV